MDIILKLKPCACYLKCLWTEPPHDKTSKMACAPSEDSYQPGLSTQSDQSSLSTGRKPGSLPTHGAHSEDSDQTGRNSDQTGRMPKLIWAFAGRTVILLVLSWGGSTLIEPRNETRIIDTTMWSLMRAYTVPPTSDFLLHHFDSEQIQGNADRKIWAAACLVPVEKDLFYIGGDLCLWREDSLKKTYNTKNCKKSFDEQKHMAFFTLVEAPYFDRHEHQTRIVAKYPWWLWPPIVRSVFTAIKAKYTHLDSSIKTDGIVDHAFGFQTVDVRSIPTRISLSLLFLLILFFFILAFFLESLIFSHKTLNPIYNIQVQ